MTVVWRVLDVVGILLGVAAALYLFTTALWEGSERRHADGRIVAVATAATSSSHVMVATQDGSLYAYSLEDSAWYACGSVPVSTQK